jgi:hypothetical protein
MSPLRPFRTSYPGYFQTAYVTNDLQRAMAQLGKGYRIRDWHGNAEFTLRTQSGASASIKVALAYVGDTQIEIIEPAGGDDGLYRDYLAGSGFQLVFHHLCKAFDTQEQYAENIDWLRREGVPLPVLLSAQESKGFGSVCYADFRETLGHYLEYVWFGEVGRAFMSAVPRN